jgi:hypothetical protein
VTSSLFRLLAVFPLVALAACVSPLPSEPGPSELPVAERPAEADRIQESAEPAAPTPVETEPAVSSGKTAPRARSRSAAPPPPDLLPDQPMEEVVVTPASLTGYWRLTASHSIEVEIGLFSGVQIRYGGEWLDRNICWLQQSGRRLTALCSSGVALKSAEGSVDEDGVTMRWWAGPANIIFSGKLTEAGRIKGGFSGGVVGLKVTGTVPAMLSKLDLPADEGKRVSDPDRPSAALLRGVWEDVGKGRLTEGRYEAAAVKRVDQGLSAETAAAPPQSLIYLGRILIRWRKEQRELAEDVYQVQSGMRRHLCRIGLNEVRQVTDFNCGTLPG